MNAYKKDFENALEMIEWQNTMLRQQQAEIEALKTRIERMVEKQSYYEAMAHAGGVEVGKELLVKEVMSENCTCYKLGYSQLNDYAKVKAK
jgi:hypothetical protein